MEALNTWIKNLILVVIFAGFIQLLIPGDTFSRYVRVVMGFFIIITLLNPLLSFLQLNLEEEIPWPVVEGTTFLEIQGKGEELRQRGEEEIFHHIQREREREMHSLLEEEGFPVARLEVTIDEKNHIQGIRLLLEASSIKEEERQREEERIEEILTRIYRLPTSRVHLDWNE